jgi:hypothetical protein
MERYRAQQMAEVMRLSGQQATVFNCVVVAGMTLQETADAIGVTKKHVNQLMYLIRQNVGFETNEQLMSFAVPRLTRILEGSGRVGCNVIIERNSDRALSTISMDSMMPVGYGMAYRIDFSDIPGLTEWSAV